MTDRPPPRSWSLYVEKSVAAAILRWPPELARAVTLYLRSFALECGDAYAKGRDVPGDRLDDSGRWFSRVIDRPAADDESVIFEFLIDPPTRQIRVSTVVWYTLDP